MRITIILEVAPRTDGGIARAWPCSLDVDGPVTPALLDELKAIVRRINGQPDPAAIDMAAIDRILTELGELTGILKRAMAN